ncbi:MAG: zinc-dependent peptidase [Planctomycetes bacterium]|nr:zinc-dependent peptidase [Planctomycetota bacterium]
MFGAWRRWRRRRVRERPFPAAWREHLVERVPLYQELDDAERAELEGHVQVLLAEKHFEGCDGLEITDEVRVTIAGHAALLLLHRDTDYFSRLQTVLVYPRGYHAHGEERLPDGTVVEGKRGRLGESWTGGVVVLSWADLLGGAQNPRDGQNVALHEFAHQLDQEDGQADGAPVLEGGRRAYAAWAHALAPEFERLQARVQKGRRTDLDAYGATNPAEFFAVVTEAFFERPEKLEKRHPELYAALAEFYVQDPAARRRARRGRE